MPLLPRALVRCSTVLNPTQSDSIRETARRTPGLSLCAPRYVLPQEAGWEQRLAGSRTCRRLAGFIAVAFGAAWVHIKTAFVPTSVGLAWKEGMFPKE